MISRKNVKEADHSVNLGVTRQDNIKDERAGVKQTGFSWLRFGDQRRVLIHGNILLGSITADKHLVQCGGYWRSYPKIIFNNLFSGPSKHTHPSEGQAKVTPTQKNR